MSHTNIEQLAKASTMALLSMLVIVVTVITQGPRLPSEMRGPIKGSLIINDGVFQAIGVISFGASISLVDIVKHSDSGYSFRLSPQLAPNLRLTQEAYHR